MTGEAGGLRGGRELPRRVEGRGAAGAGTRRGVHRRKVGVNLQRPGGLDPQHPSPPPCTGRMRGCRFAKRGVGAVLFRAFRSHQSGVLSHAGVQLLRGCVVGPRAVLSCVAVGCGLHEA